MQLTRNQVYLPLCLCLVCRALYGAVSVQAIAYTAREAVFGGLCAALVWALVSFVLLQLGRGLAEGSAAETCSNVVREKGAQGGLVGGAAGEKISNDPVVASSAPVAASDKSAATGCIPTASSDSVIVSGAQGGALCAATVTATKALLCLTMLVGMAQTAAQQLQFYAVQFGTGGAWLALFCVAACCLHATPYALVRCARVLLWLCAAAALCAVLGLATQSDLQRLATTPLTTAGVGAAFWVGIGCYPEYFLLAICPSVKCKRGRKIENDVHGDRQGDVQSATQSDTAQEVCGKRCGTYQQKNYKKCENIQQEAPLLLLPLAPFGVQCAAVFCTELLFGVQEAGVGGFEFLRSWALLNFSRYDGVVALLWLLLAFFRLRVFAFAVAQAWPIGLCKPARDG